MADPIGTVARASAQRLVPELGARIVLDVEQALRGSERQRRPDQYLDPVSVGALIVSVATFAWTVYTDTRARGGTSDAETVARTVRVKLTETGDQRSEIDDTVIEIVVDETIRHADGDQPG